mmetsp:Transcript_127177/g.231066  ORF Transcript_127177/g.231066 Transcript_127177/m.231066 type:complete len:289 (-) Transcript_127177:14-880(-)
MVLWRPSDSQGLTEMLAALAAHPRSWRAAGVGQHPSVVMAVSFGEEGKGEPDTKMESAFGPELHGRTPNNEACRCLPGTVEPPSTATLMRKAVESREVSREEHRNDYRERIDQVNSGTEDEIKAATQNMKKRDEALQELKKYSDVVEALAKEMKESFEEAKSIYEENDCLRIKEQAEEHEEEVPKCHEEYMKAAKDMKAISALVAPHCKIGAVRMAPLQLIGADKKPMEMSSFPLAAISAAELLLRNLRVSRAAELAPGLTSSLPGPWPRSLRPQRLQRRVAASRAFL